MQPMSKHFVKSYGMGCHSFNFETIINKFGFWILKKAYRVMIHHFEWSDYANVSFNTAVFSEKTDVPPPPPTPHKPAYGGNFSHEAVILKIRSRSPKSTKPLILVRFIYTCKFGNIPCNCPWEMQTNTFWLAGRGSSIGSMPAWHASGPEFEPTSDTFFRGDLVMTKFLRPFSLFRWFKKSNCKLLVKECALSTQSGKLSVW